MEPDAGDAYRNVYRRWQATDSAFRDAGMWCSICEDRDRGTLHRRDVEVVEGAAYE